MARRVGRRPGADALWRDDLGGLEDGPRADDLGAEALPVVPTPSRGIFFSRVIAAVTSDTDDIERGLSDGLSRYDDVAWSWYVRQPFTWQRFIDWWAARRWMMPRDVRKQ